MAKQRYIKDSFWTDPYIQNLWQTEKLLFLYLLTNQNCNIAWIYEITERQICFDTGIEKNRLAQSVDKLSKDGKISYKNNRIIIINFIKNQNVNPSVEKGIERVINQLPDWIKDSLGTGCIQTGTYSTLLNSTLLNSTEVEENSNSIKNNLQNSKEGEVAFFENSDIDIVFKEYIKTRKSKPTDRAIELLKKTLDKYPDDIKIKMIEKSIMNWWTWIFPLDWKEVVDYDTNDNFHKGIQSWKLEEIKTYFKNKYKDDRQTKYWETRKQYKQSPLYLENTK